MNELNKDSKILIIGLGLMGGSYAHALSDEGYYVGAIDKNPDAIRYAIDNGLIKSGRTDSDESYVGQFDLIIFGLYPGAFLEWIENNQKCLKQNALITDVTGVKKCIIYKIQEVLRDDLEYIGAHPMAGKESSGVNNADKAIFHKANYIITPTDVNSEKAIAICRQIGEILGFKTIRILSPEKHDEMIAFLSQLTHCIAITLMTCRDSEHFIDYTGDSFRDLTRIAKINEEMWSELFLLNKDDLLCQMELFEQQFDRLRECIKNDNREEIKNIMISSTEKRKLFDESLRG